MTQRYVTNSLFLALAGVWTGLMLALALIPAYPVLGTPAVITLSGIIFSSLTAPLLGPLWGTLSGFIFGWLVPYVNPATNMGLLTFLGPTMSALMGGLVLFNRWKEATLIFVAQMIVWFAHPFAWYELMPLITWQFIPVAAFIVVPPVRKWITSTITARNNPTKLAIALWCLAWNARIGGDVAASNNNAVWVLGWGIPDLYPFWAPMTVYYAIADSLNSLAGAIIGTAVLLALKRTNIKTLAIDTLEAKR
ncbi:MAG: hypothetical protein QME50_02225 [Candidatus Bathyarchaeota archaeon]|nr:hypothetical protein [Candidatus Bathyarchaeota archaeon]